LRAVGMEVGVIPRGERANGEAGKLPCCRDTGKKKKKKIAAFFCCVLDDGARGEG